MKYINFTTSWWKTNASSLPETFVFVFNITLFTLGTCVTFFVFRVQNWNHANYRYLLIILMGKLEDCALCFLKTGNNWRLGVFLNPSCVQYFCGHNGTAGTNFIGCLFGTNLIGCLFAKSYLPSIAFVVAAFLNFLCPRSFWNRKINLKNLQNTIFLWRIETNLYIHNNRIRIFLFVRNV